MFHQRKGPKWPSKLTYPNSGKTGLTPSLQLKSKLSLMTKLRSNVSVRNGSPALDGRTELGGPKGSPFRASRYLIPRPILQPRNRATHQKKGKTLGGRLG